MDKQRQIKEVNRIARNILNIDDLESKDLYFNEMLATRIKLALEAAFDSGYEEGWFDCVDKTIKKH
jgi:hypothetical protein